jgi:hypothetical protein
MSRWSLLVAGTLLTSGCTDADPFVPDQPPLAGTIVRIQVTAEQATLAVGDSTTAVATAFGEDGSAVALVKFAWAMSDTAVAVVTSEQPSEEASLSGVAVGETELRATAGGIASEPFLITVVEPEPPGDGEG